MNVVSWGGGTNSTALILGMYEKEISIDLILFADPGSEQPHTYEHLSIMNNWLKEHGLPQITVVYYTDHNGDRLTLEEECLRSNTLPALAYGYKKCSLKHKRGPQDKFCNNYLSCKEVWARGEKMNKYIGYDAGEEHRKDNAQIYDLLDKKYNYIYALIEWGWYREDCIKKIQQHGLPLPGKSSCFFCPSMRDHEIRSLRKNHPDLLERALKIEANAELYSIKGLGRNFSWKSMLEYEDAQGKLFCQYYDDEMPCNCYDG